MILAIDPGREKCGTAVLDLSGRVLEKKIVKFEELVNEVTHLIAKYGIATLAVGSGTYSKNVQKEISKLELKANIIFVPEKYSTLEAKKRYFKENPARGFWRLLPASLRTPPQPIDDYAAVILAERFLSGY